MSYLQWNFMSLIVFRNPIPMSLRTHLLLAEMSHQKQNDSRDLMKQDIRNLSLDYQSLRNGNTIDSWNAAHF